MARYFITLNKNTDGDVTSIGVCKDGEQTEYFRVFEKPYLPKSLVDIFESPLNEICVFSTEEAVAFFGRYNCKIRVTDDLQLLGEQALRQTFWTEKELFERVSWDKKEGTCLSGVFSVLEMDVFSLSKLRKKVIGRRYKRALEEKMLRLEKQLA